jgi:DUF1680 family protein
MLLAFLCAFVSQAEEKKWTALSMESIPGVRLHLQGSVGERVDANVNRWLLEAPLANPGMLEMFRVRDREPVPQIVPWAGEFVGKYLISAIQAMRMSDDPRLEPFVREVIADLLSTQADDGYMGPFRKNERLLGQWDLWGHYHIMHALLMWHERTGDERVLIACRKMGDLICATYLGGNRRVFDAGSHEMNMAILTSLGWLYRVTKEEKYVAMMKEVLADFERAGDYHRAGLAGVPFYRTPRPRWESLHCIQGLVEMYRITGDEKYRTSYMNTWWSILRWDERNTGGFSSGEQATGNPYEDSAIETCCTIAWSALTADALRLDASSRIADALELSFYNGVLGAQHPSGRWWTYNTPMNGIREASAHTIVFQSRAGTPELNCCSVNAPRGLGMVSEWGVMRTGVTGGAGDGIALNYLGPMKAEVPLESGGKLVIETKTTYPLTGKIEFKLSTTDTSRDVILWVRVPTWAGNVQWKGGLKRDGEGRAGYQGVVCPANGSTSASVEFEMPLRVVAGDMEQVGRVSIYRGPILLAYDQTLNDFDANQIPPIDLDRLPEATITIPPAANLAPWREKPAIVAELPAGDQVVRVADFASAGATGTTYRSWLAARNAPPPAPKLLEPRAEAVLPPGPMALVWRRAARDESLRFHVNIREADRKDHLPLIELKDQIGPRLILSAETTRVLKPKVPYVIELISINASGKKGISADPVRFQIDDSLPPLSPDELMEFGERADGCVIEADLASTAEPTYGRIDQAEEVEFIKGNGNGPAGSARVQGGKTHLTYKVRRFPDDYSLSIWVKFDQLGGGLGQIVSGWCKGGDDPLRLCIDGGKLFARIEGMGGASTPGVDLPTGRWVALAVVKRGDSLRLFVDGEEVAKANAPKRLMSSSVAIGIGRNPRYGIDESVAGQFARLRFFSRPLSDEEIKTLALSASK